MFNIIRSPNNEKVICKIKGLPKAQTRWIRKAFYYIGKDLVKDADKLIMQKPKHGKIYLLRRNGLKRLHRASAPGEAPANFTGSLRQSLDFDVVGADRMQFGVKQRFQNRQGTPDGVKYGKYLELGTRKMVERPFLLPTIKKNYRNIRKHFETQLKRGLTKEATP
jgi:HK97 gp10 family phage protein